MENLIGVGNALDALSDEEFKDLLFKNRSNPRIKRLLVCEMLHINLL